ncbi:hypothetical protein EYF80_042866 [Liparis tanakae]|uniref:Uncharacterized protein n=1 Tax=Liparis tanakae TaxID=230148 RepID=A0A4Z2G1B4_9TELE|nr:hypothetical protein EYF80_042866 [Liparis tanakae]
MAEAPHRPSLPEYEEEEDEQQSGAEATKARDGSEKPKPSGHTRLTRPLGALKSMSIVDPEDDCPDMIVYRKICR